MFIKNILSNIRHAITPDLNFHKPRAKRVFTVATSIAALVLAGTIGAEVRTGGTGRTVSYGEIDAFGSIVVSGVHHDETNANIIINGAQNQTKAQLKLGMIVDIDGDVNYGAGTGVARVVTVNRRLFGQIENITGNGTELRVLNQRISLSATTRLDGAISSTELQPGDWVAVHGLDDSQRQMIAATLIERMTSGTQFASEIRGTVNWVQNGRLRIGGLEVLYDANTTGTAGLEKGRFVAASGIYLSPMGVLLASNLIVTREVEIQEHAEAKLQGFVADFRGIDSFTVSGVPVNATGAVFERGTVADLRHGARVTVEGVVVNGILMANEISLPSTLSNPTTNPTSQKSSPAELEGIISQFNSPTDFVIKGRRIDASNIVFGPKSARPALGRKAKVKGVIQLDGSIEATLVVVER